MLPRAATLLRSLYVACRKRQSFQKIQSGSVRTIFNMRPLASPDKPRTTVAPYLIQDRFKTSPNDIFWKCTEFDSKGNVRELARKYSKLDFCHMHALQPRDLRKLDSRFVDQYPAVLVRPSTILLNLNHIRALINKDQCIMFDTPGTVSSIAHTVFVSNLQTRLSQCGLTPSAVSASHYKLPYEFVVLETIFQSVISTLEQELHDLSTPVNLLINRLMDSTNSGFDHRKHLVDLYTYVQLLASFEQKVSNIRDVVKELLDTDEDMAQMCLTWRHETGNSVEMASQQPESSKIQDLELLLETYLANTEEILDMTSSLLQTITNTERFITLTLDSQRNALLILEIKFAMFGVACSSGAVIGSIFGMNLPNGFEQTPPAFVVVCIVTGIVSTSVLGSGIWRMKNLTRNIGIKYSNQERRDLRVLSSIGSGHHGNSKRDRLRLSRPAEE